MLEGHVLDFSTNTEVSEDLQNFTFEKKNWGNLFIFIRKLECHHIK